MVGTLSEQLQKANTKTSYNNSFSRTSRRKSLHDYELKKQQFELAKERMSGMSVSEYTSYYSSLPNWLQASFKSPSDLAIEKEKYIGESKTTLQSKIEVYQERMAKYRRLYKKNPSRKDFKEKIAEYKDLIRNLSTSGMANIEQGYTLESVEKYVNASTRYDTYKGQRRKSYVESLKPAVSTSGYDSRSEARYIELESNKGKKGFVVQNEKVFKLEEPLLPSRNVSPADLQRFEISPSGKLTGISKEKAYLISYTPVAKDKAIKKTNNAYGNKGFDVQSYYMPVAKKIVIEKTNKVYGSEGVRAFLETNKDVIEQGRITENEKVRGDIFADFFPSGINEETAKKDYPKIFSEFLVASGDNKQLNEITSNKLILSERDWIRANPKTYKAQVSTRDVEKMINGKNVFTFGSATRESLSIQRINIENELNALYNPKNTFEKKYLKAESYGRLGLAVGETIAYDFTAGFGELGAEAFKYSTKGLGFVGKRVRTLLPKSKETYSDERLDSINNFDMMEKAVSSRMDSVVQGFQSTRYAGKSSAMVSALKSKGVKNTAFALEFLPIAYAGAKFGAKGLMSLADDFEKFGWRGFQPRNFLKGKSKKEITLISDDLIEEPLPLLESERTIYRKGRGSIPEIESKSRLSAKTLLPEFRIQQYRVWNVKTKKYEFVSGYSTSEALISARNNRGVLTSRTKAKIPVYKRGKIVMEDKLFTEKDLIELQFSKQFPEPWRTSERVEMQNIIPQYLKESYTDLTLKQSLSLKKAVGIKRIQKLKPSNMETTGLITRRFSSPEFSGMSDEDLFKNFDALITRKNKPVVEKTMSFSNPRKTQAISQNLYGIKFKDEFKKVSTSIDNIEGVTLLDQYSLKKGYSSYPIQRANKVGRLVVNFDLTTALNKGRTLGQAYPGSNYVKIYMRNIMKNKQTRGMLRQVIGHEFAHTLDTGADSMLSNYRSLFDFMKSTKSNPIPSYRARNYKSLSNIGAELKADYVGGAFEPKIQKAFSKTYTAKKMRARIKDVKFNVEDINTFSSKNIYYDLEKFSGMESASVFESKNVILGKLNLKPVLFKSVKTESFVKNLKEPVTISNVKRFQSRNPITKSKKFSSNLELKSGASLKQVSVTYKDYDKYSSLGGLFYDKTIYPEIKLQGEMFNLGGILKAQFSDKLYLSTGLAQVGKMDRFYGVGKTRVKYKFATLGERIFDRLSMGDRLFMKDRLSMKQSRILKQLQRTSVLKRAELKHGHSSPNPVPYSPKITFPKIIIPRWDWSMKLDKDTFGKGKKKRIGKSSYRPSVISALTGSTAVMSAKEFSKIENTLQSGLEVRPIISIRG